MAAASSVQLSGNTESLTWRLTLVFAFALYCLFTSVSPVFFLQEN